MRKLKLQMQLTIDGFVGRPNGELDWMDFNWDDTLKDYVTALTDSVDTIVMGRNLATGFIPYWKNVASNPDDFQYDFGKKMTDKPKIVFTRTLETLDPIVIGWDNTKLGKGDLVKEITELKNQQGKDIVVYGGATFVSDLIKHNLVDEYHLFINPVVIGNGMTIFKDLPMKKLELIKTTTSSNGIIILFYKPK
ncbi:MAG: dihydrofolate reductase family protein [Ginsengibacter sp.]